MFALATAVLHFKAGGSTWLKTESHGNSIGRRVPDIGRMLLFKTGNRPNTFERTKPTL